MALRTIMMASCSDRSVSSVNCSAPPLRMMVHVLALGQPLKKLYLQTQRRAWAVATRRDVCYSLERIRRESSYLSPPTWTSSKTSHCPRTSSVIELTVVWIEPPQAWRSHYTQSVWFNHLLSCFYHVISCFLAEIWVCNTKVNFNN